MTHIFKLKKHYFRITKEGIKTFEVRKFNLDYIVGDYILFKEVNDHDNQPNGNTFVARITYIFTGGKFGIEEGYCILGIKLV